MVYYVKTKKTIQKYNIEIDQDKLNELEEDIIKNCCKLEHFEEEFEGDFFWKTHDPKTTINVHYVKVGVKEYFEETVDVYKYSYDIIDTSPLMKFIKKFRDEDSSVIDDIAEQQKEEDLLLGEMRKIMNDIKEISSESEKEKLKADLDIISDEYFRLDKERPYIDRMQELIDIKELKVIKKDEVNKVYEFFNKKDKTKYGKVRML